MADQHSIGQYYTTKRSIRQLKWNERHHFAIEDVIIIIRESKMMTTMTKMKQQLKRSEPRETRRYCLFLSSSYTIMIILLLSIRVWKETNS